MKKNLEVIANYHVSVNRSIGGAGYYIQIVKNGKPEYYIRKIVGKKELDLKKLNIGINEKGEIISYNNYDYKIKPTSLRKALKMKEEEKIFKIKNKN